MLRSFYCIKFIIVAIILNVEEAGSLNEIKDASLVLSSKNQFTEGSLTIYSVIHNQFILLSIYAYFTFFNFVVLIDNASKSLLNLFQDKI